MKIGVYVGSFNPVHKGHIKIVNYLLDNFLDKVIIMPTGGYWDKNDLASTKDRINMLKSYKDDRIIIEEENNDLPYTYMVMEFLEKKYKSNEFYLIIGADNIVNFDKWQKYKELLKYNIAIVSRENIDVEHYLNKLNKKDKYLIINDLGNIDISSTKIRNLIKSRAFTELKELVDEDVLTVLKRQVKQRNDSLSEFERLGKNEAAEDLKKEIEIINSYLPEEASVEEIEKTIDEAFKEINPTGMKEMGIVMRYVTEHLKNADMTKVSNIVKERLTK